MSAQPDAVKSADGEAEGCARGGPHSPGERRRLDLGDGSSAILCERCFNQEMWWRGRRNDHLKRFGHLTKPDQIERWEDLEVYTIE